MGPIGLIPPPWRLPSSPWVNLPNAPDTAAFCNAAGNYKIAAMNPANASRSYGMLKQRLLTTPQAR
ncbi:hypothetical protein [Xylella fastidiosa]|uniref:hypothetical protein n=1 Tax=Xylella fastidiosa TaxID=2371 RepID=UPI0035D4F8FB